VATNLVKRGDIYYVRVMVNGRRYWRSTGHTTEKMALRKADEIKVKLRDGRGQRDLPIPTFGEWVDTFKRTHLAAQRAPWRYDQVLDPAVRALGRIDLDQLTRSRIVQYLNSRKIASSTRRTEHTMLHTVLKQAVDEGLLDRHPMAGLKRPPSGVRVRILAEENEPLLRAQLRPRSQRWLTFMLGTGLRIQEARGVTFADVDRAARTIRVRPEFAKGGKGRLVPLYPEVEEAVLAEFEEAGKLWHSHDRSWVRRLAEGAAAAGIPHLSPHDLRHTFATRFIARGGDIYVLSKVLGHSSVTITEKLYVHLEPEDVVRRALAYTSPAAKSGATSNRPDTEGSMVA
jgi:integrase/recombinase XerD